MHYRAQGLDWKSRILQDQNVADESADPNSWLSLYHKLIHVRHEHIALRAGKYFAIDTDNTAIFANLRVSAAEIILVVTNVSAKQINDYTLNLETSPLAGNYTLAPLLDIGMFTSPTITAQGGFENYQPLPELPHHGRFILQLQRR